MKPSQKKAVFLDRDGVINRCVVIGGNPFPPSKLEDVEILQGVTEALKRLKNAGFLLICVTNQPDVARGKQSRKIVEAIHRFLIESLPLDEIVVCYHDDSDACRCRKPLPGMLIDAAKRYSINLRDSFMVGDRWRDIEAGRNAGCKTILIGCDYEEKRPETYDYLVKTLIEAATLIINYLGGDAHETD